MTACRRRSFTIARCFGCVAAAGSRRCRRSGIRSVAVASSGQCIPADRRKGARRAGWSIARRGATGGPAVPLHPAQHQPDGRGRPVPRLRPRDHGSGRRGRTWVSPALGPAVPASHGGPSRSRSGPELRQRDFSRRLWAFQHDPLRQDLRPEPAEAPWGIQWRPLERHRRRQRRCYLGSEPTRRDRNAAVRAATSSALTSRAKWPASRRWTSASGTSRR